MTTMVELPEWPQPARLRAALAGAGVEVGEMADYLGVTRQTVSRWIAGTSPVRDGAMRLWAMRTGVPFEWLKGQPECTVRDLNPEPADLELWRRRQGIALAVAA